MNFDFFQTSEDAHIRKAREYLQQASLARIEHQVAAEHHAALASMYTQRIAWLEQELASANSGYNTPLRGVPPKQVEGPKRGPRSILSWPRTPRLDGNPLPESA